jgi:hypothetical protein
MRALLFDLGSKGVALMDKNWQRQQASLAKELEAMSDWELERGCAASSGFDLDQRVVADRTLRERYTGPEHHIALWTLALSVLAAAIALMSVGNFIR